jgi:hypothetical protein
VPLQTKIYPETIYYPSFSICTKTTNRHTEGRAAPTLPPLINELEVISYAYVQQNGRLVYNCLSYIFTKCHCDHNCFSVKYSWFLPFPTSYTSWMPKYYGFGHCTNGTWACTIIDFYNCANFDMPGPSLTDGEENEARFIILNVAVYMNKSIASIVL